MFSPTIHILYKSDEEIIMKINCLIIILASILMTGCASIISDNTYLVKINSNPAEAYFTIKDDNGFKMHSGKTPSMVTLASGGVLYSC